jgi:hypothetical protein
MNENSNRGLKNIRALLKSPQHVNTSFQETSHKKNNPIPIKKYTTEKSNEHSVSFNITPEEEEITSDLRTLHNKSTIPTTLYSQTIDTSDIACVNRTDGDIVKDRYIVNKSIDIAEGNRRATHEAMQLINSTKKIIENLDSTKNTGVNISTARKPISQENSYLTTLCDEKPKDFSKISRIERDTNISSILFLI